MNTTEEDNIRNAVDKAKQEILEKVMGLNICANSDPWYFSAYECLKEDIKKIILTGKGKLFKIQTYNDGLAKGREQAAQTCLKDEMEFLKNIRDTRIKILVKDDKWLNGTLFELNNRIKQIEQKLKEQK